MGRAACRFILGVLLLVTAHASRPVADRASLPDSHTPFRQLLQAQQLPLNCTPPHSFSATKVPFCFQPDTISTEARQLLSQLAAGNTPFGTAPSKTPAPADPAAATAAVGTVREFYRQSMMPLHKAAVGQFLQSVRNITVGNVSVVIGVPKGMSETDPVNTKVLLYMHGGGYVSGSCHWLLNTVAATAAYANLTIICPEYRLAPEHPFPTGLNDVLSVYKTLIKSDGYNPKNIVFLGDSAGGGLVAASAVQLQTENEALPAALGMFLPGADVLGRGDTRATLNGVDPLLVGTDALNPAEALLQNDPLGAAYTAGNTSRLSDPLVSPVLADYAKLFPNRALPPTLIQVGLRGVLLSDAVRLYHRMREAAPAPGHVVLSPYEGMWHVFQGFVTVPEADAASREMAAYFIRALNGHICK